MGTLIFQITEIPDQTYPQYQILAQGNVVDAAGHDFEHLLRAIANLPPGAASTSIRFSFDPKPVSGNVQSRLGIYVIAQCRDTDQEENMRLLIERGALRRFYQARMVNHFKAPWDKLKGACDVVRRVDALAPLHSSEFNDRIPSSYYTISPFESSDRNDYLELDSVLSEINETAIIDICVQPVDVSSELSAHTKYLFQLQSINKKWDLEDDDGLDDFESLGNDTGPRHRWMRDIKPLRYTDPLADDILRSQQRFHEKLREPHLLFRIRVLAQTRAMAHLLGSVVAELAFESGSYRLQSCQQSDEIFAEALLGLKESRIVPLPGFNTPYEGRDMAIYSGLARLNQLATVDELLGAYRLPVASLNSPKCIRKNTDTPIEDISDLVVFGIDQDVPGLLLGPTLFNTVKGLSLFGVPGSGKTTAAINFILQVHERGIPFLLIETAKTEYRILKTLQNHPDKDVQKLAKEMEIYTAGFEYASPFRYNPLELLAGIFTEERIGDVLGCFYASMPLEGPLQSLLGEALERVYEEYPSMDKPPMVSDLVNAAHRVLDEKGYSEDTDSDIRSALEVRLGSLTRLGIGKVFQCRKSIPSIDHLFKVPAVLELDCLPPDQACLLTLFLLSSIREYLKTAPKSDMIPRYVMIIEEAHNIVGRDTNAAPSPDVANPKVFAAEAVSRALLEFRGLGVSVVIVDQCPSRIAPEVIKATTTKLAFRQVHQEDREELGASMLFGSIELEEIARLLPGEAFLFTEGFYKSRKIRAVNIHDRFRIT